MKQIPENYYQQYDQLVQEVTSMGRELEEQHRKHMACKSGCDLCCMDYSILPVEFYAIRDKLRKASVHAADINLNHTEPETCIFLKNHLCTIYQQRPLICRTHGLPLLFVNDDDEWELSACDLNFTKFDIGRFTEKNTFPQDKFNSKLFMLNKQFVSDFKEVKHGEFDLIPIRDLAEQL